MLSALSKKPADSLAALPRLRDVYPPYAALLDRQAELGKLRETTRQQLIAKIESSQKAATHGEHRVAAPPPSEQNRIRRRAEMLGDPAPTFPIAAAEDEVDDGSLEALSRKSKEIEEAQIELDSRLRVARREASRILCEMVAPRFRELQSELIAKVIAFSESYARLDVFLDTLTDDNAEIVSLNPVLPRFCESPRNRYSDVHTFLHEAVEAGWIKKSDLPARMQG